MTNTTAPAPRADETQAAPAIQDAGTLRMGGLSPIFRPQGMADRIADAGTLRMGGLSPIFQAR
jgi:hypothetical protein